jgi:membrane protease YdiL (CAAX protease family)
MYIVAEVFLWLAVGSFPGLTDDPSDEAISDFMRIAMVPMIVLRCATTIAVIAFILTIRRQTIRSLGLTLHGFLLNVPIGVGAMLVAFWFTTLTLQLLAMVWPSTLQEMEENAELITSAVPNLSPLGFTGLALLIGFYEELVFRGFLMTRLRRVLGSWTLAVVVSTVVFTSLHAMDQTWPALIAVSILSVVFSVVTIWRRSLVPAIVGHVLFNLFQFLWLRFQMGDSWT